MSDIVEILYNDVLKNIPLYEIFSNGKQYHTLFLAGALITTFLIDKDLNI